MAGLTLDGYETLNGSIPAHQGYERPTAYLKVLPVSWLVVDHHIADWLTRGSQWQCRRHHRYDSSLGTVMCTSVP